MNTKEAFQTARKHHRDGDLEQAEYAYLEILRIQPHSVGAYYELGNVLQDKGQLDKAVDSYKRAIESDPNFAGSYNNMGTALNKMGRIEEAISCYQKTVELVPNFAGGYINLGVIFFQTNRLDEAITYFRKAMQIDPNIAIAYFNMGNIYKSKEQPDEALKHYLKAIELDPNCAEFYFNAGVVFQAANQIDEALKYYDKTIELDPRFARAYLNKSLIRLLSGDLRQGWKEYEWRWKLEEFYRLLPNTSKPIWNGDDLNGLTLLLYAEQGFGDTIQFIRYVPLVAERGAIIIVECQKELTSLAGNVPGVSRVIAQGEKLPEFDTHCSLLSLPLIFDTTLETIPANVPYITVDRLILKKWKDKIGPDNSKMKVGLVWAGNPTNTTGMYRSCTLDNFSSLAQPDITFYSLQKGGPSIQAKNPPDGMRLFDYTDEINDFYDTAALIENLDLVISVDTAVAHLAGALGKPVWTLIPFAPDWRWMLNRGDSPWYPTMKLFRQSSPGDWDMVIAGIAEKLQEYRKSMTSNSA